MRIVNPWLLPLGAALAMVSASAPAVSHACTYPEPALYPVRLLRATPEDPVPTLPSGAPILLQDYGVTGSSLELTNAAGGEILLQTDVLEVSAKSPGWRLLRVLPEATLTPGNYTLQVLYYPLPGASEPREVSYPFTVVGTAVDTSSAQFDFAAYPITYPTGKEFACQPITTSCGEQTPSPATTQRKHHVSIAIRNPEAATDEAGQFLYRLISTDPGTNPDDAQYWFAGVPGYGSTLAVEFRDVRPEYCVELQTLRVRDLELRSLGKHCVKFSLPTEPDPAVFYPCQANPGEYARAWCNDNQAACSKTNPRAGEETVETPCQYYAEICAPLIGNRELDQLECTP